LHFPHFNLSCYDDTIHYCEGYSYFVDCFLSFVGVTLVSRHGRGPDCVFLKELAFNCIWQLSFGNSYNRHRLREAGAENELWRIAHSTSTTPAQSSRSMAVLGWLKSQVIKSAEAVLILTLSPYAM
jgi:hypothetical protein